MGRLRMTPVVATALAGALVLGLVACTTGVSVGVGYRTPGWYSYHGRSPFYRCCRSPVVVVPPEPEFPIDPDEPIAVPLPEPGFGGGFDGDFGGGFGGGDFGGGDFGGDF